VAPVITAERSAIVNEARDGWIKRLIDLSRRNNLLYYRDLKTATYDFSDAGPGWVSSLLSGESVMLSQLVSEEDETAVSALLREIRKRALANMEEKGLQTLFLALGMATWIADDEGRPPESPVLLVPISIEARGREGGSLKLTKTGDTQINQVLLFALAQLGCEINPDGLLDNIEDEEAPLDPGAVYNQIKKSVKIKGFDIKPRIVLANFSFQKMAMVKDLQQGADQMAGNDIIAAIAGDATARANLRMDVKDVNPCDLDDIKPENELLVLDADSSQERVALLVASGQSGVIEGPPGTGKSQTIVNLIASLVAQGRRILFVAEKRAALEVVQRRLEEIGLKHIAIDLHGADLSRRMIIGQIGDDLKKIQSTGPVNYDANFLQKFSDRRKRLNAYARQLHMERSPSGLSVFAIMGRLLRLPGEARSSARWRGEELSRLDSSSASAVKDRLAELAGFDNLYLQNDPSPWTGCRLTDGETMQLAMDTVNRLNKTWLSFLELLDPLLEEVGIGSLEAREEVKTLLDLLQKVSATLSLYNEDLFVQDPEQLSHLLGPAGRGDFSAFWAFLFDGAYRRSLGMVRKFRKGGPASAAQILKEISTAGAQLDAWRKYNFSRTVPYAIKNIDEIHESLEALESDLKAIAGLFPQINFDKISINELSSFLKGLYSDAVTPYRIPRMLQIAKEVENYGCGNLLSEIRQIQSNSRFWTEMFEYAWLRSCLDRALAEDPILSGFNGRTHEEFVREFCDLDRDKLKYAVSKVRRNHAERVIEIMNQYPEQASLIQSETRKKARHLSLRKLLAKAPDVLTALCPCWMASPLSVSQLMDTERRYFDVILFDEGSQVLPEDAVPSLMRASQVVVAGDQHQLPPTMFFANSEDDDDEEGDPLPTEGYESILDLASSFLPSWLLEWHYRSHDEKLIAFSNHHIYNDSLITFPGPRGQSAVSHVLVPFNPGQDGQDDSSSEEVRRVVEMILDHGANYPEETLGVITMGMRHMRRIEAALEEALRSHPELDEFFDHNRLERFFVKNLERVQGDERDVIILSVGYGKDRSGRLLYRFGPLLTEGGERRLNVALTRARCRMIIVSSFDHHDMDPSRCRGKGVQLLRSCLEYAASNGCILGDPGESSVPPNAFEADIFDTLSAAGIPLNSQWGASRYRIDLVAKHPERPGEFVLAIECDGATYHSTPTARDRDRLRQQHLVALGWRFHRIWSTDWFMRREQEIERAVAAYKEAVEYADRKALSDHPPKEDDSHKDSDYDNDTMTHPLERPVRPSISQKSSIKEYSMTELTALVGWILSDGQLLTDEQIVQEMISQLGFHRRGPRIEAAIMAAIKRVKTKAMSQARG
jgi:very-short-patch-repair endonuclease